MTDTLDDLLESLDRALQSLKTRGEERHTADIDNLIKVKRVLQGLDPDEVEALLESDEEE